MLCLRITPFRQLACIWRHLHTSTKPWRSLSPFSYGAESPCGVCSGEERKETPRRRRIRVVWCEGDVVGAAARKDRERGRFSCSRGGELCQAVIKSVWLCLVTHLRAKARGPGCSGTNPRLFRHRGLRQRRWRVMSCRLCRLSPAIPSPRSKPSLAPFVVPALPRAARCPEVVQHPG